MSPEQKAKIASSHIGIRPSKASREKMALAKVGKPSWNKGKSSPWAGKNGFQKGNKPWNTGIKKQKEKRPHASIGRKMPLKIRLKISEGRRKAFLRDGHNYSFDPKNVMRRDRKAIRRERIAKNGGFHSKQEWEDLKKEASYSCGSCFKKEPEIRLTRDHIVAISMGGTDNIGNIQPLCMMCNSLKSTKSL